MELLQFYYTPVGQRATRPPVLKITWCVLTRYENSLLYLMLQCIMRERPLQKVEADRGAACASLHCAGASLRSGGVRKGDGRV